MRIGSWSSSAVALGPTLAFALSGALLLAPGPGLSPATPVVLLTGCRVLAELTDGVLPRSQKEPP